MFQYRKFCRRIFFGNGPLFGNGDPQKAVAFSVLSFPGFEETGKMGGFLRIPAVL